MGPNDTKQCEYKVSLRLKDVLSQPFESGKQTRSSKLWCVSQCSMGSMTVVLSPSIKVLSRFVFGLRDIQRHVYL